MSNIAKRTYYVVGIKLLSPLCVSSGEGYYTDSDVIRNGNGECFIPGTSLAGAFRNYLEEKKEEDSIFGYAHGEDGKMSSIYVSDLYFSDKEVPVSIRDHASLTDKREVLNKYDREVIDPGAEGILRIEAVLRAGDTQPQEEKISSILHAIQSGEIRFGSGKNRGFGRMAIKYVQTDTFSAGRRGEWVEFLQNGQSAGKALSYNDWAAKEPVAGKKYIKVRNPLKLSGGISIRRYSTKPEKADFEHITIRRKLEGGRDADAGNEVPVIPGSSWNGAIRSDAKRILKELGLAESAARELVSRWFGTENDEEAERKQSAIIISESEICNAGALQISRNKVDRFTGGTVDGALYSEISWFGGETCLEYMVRKNDGMICREALGIMHLVTEDIKKGYVAIGGQAAVGRGIFEAQEKPASYSEDINISECMRSLFQAIKERRGDGYRAAEEA